MAQGGRLIAVLCLLVTGCGTFHLPTGAASTSRTSTPQAASAARVASAPRLSSHCPTPQLPRSYPSSPSSDRNLVIAKLRGNDQTVIRDVTDIDHPSTVATVDVPGFGGDGWGSPSFVSSSTISYRDTDGRQLFRMPISGSGAQLVAAWCAYANIASFGWSRDGQSFSYLLEPEDWITNLAQTEFQWHLVTGGVDRVIGTAPLWCHCGAGSENNSLAVQFSPNGQFVSLVDYLQRGTTLQVRRLDGSVAGAEIRRDRDDVNPVTMGVWSGTDLFFRDGARVERWHEGTITQFLPGIAWLHPWASPAGGQIVYAVRGGDGLAHVNVVDTGNRLTRQLSSQPRTMPIFLTPRYVWYRGERLCTPSDAMCRTTALTGNTYIYDLQTDTEWESIITAVADVWPHGG